VTAIKSGELVPDAHPEILKEDATSALISGNWTFGQVAATLAMEKAITKADQKNVSVVGLVQIHHVGRLGEYVETAAAHGMASMIWAGGFSEEAPAAVPYGGREKVLHTNPISIGFPTAEEPPVMFDFATTVTSGVKVVNAQRNNEELPSGWIVDKDGKPTTDPNDFFEGGGHVPFGGHKGYGLMVAAEFLGQLLTASSSYADEKRAGAVLRHHGVTMIVAKGDVFRDAADFAQEADAMARRIRRVPPAPGFQEVLVPGDPESRTRARRRREGIPLADTLWKELVDLADSLGVPVGQE
jgi:LDH2 family malate/lactate/ureidoglycolate dehydrogenase